MRGGQSGRLRAVSMSHALTWLMSAYLGIGVVLLHVGPLHRLIVDAMQEARMRRAMQPPHEPPLPPPLLSALLLGRPRCCCGPACGRRRCVAARCWSATVRACAPDDQCPAPELGTIQRAGIGTGSRLASQVPSTPQPVMIAMPSSVSASGAWPNPIQPTSVAKTIWKYRKGVSVAARARM